MATANILALWALAVPGESERPILKINSSSPGSLHGRGNGIVFLRMLVSKSAIGHANRAQTAPFRVSLPAAIIAARHISNSSLTHHSCKPSLKNRMEPSSPLDDLLIQWNTARSICCTRVVYFDGDHELACNVAIPEDLVSHNLLDETAMDAPNAHGPAALDARFKAPRIPRQLPQPKSTGATNWIAAPKNDISLSVGGVYVATHLRGRNQDVRKRMAHTTAA